MSEHHPTACYADRAWHGSVPVEANVRLARDTYRLRVRSPAIAERIVPGQFAMLRLPGGDDPLLGRPLALWDVAPDAAGRAVGVDIVYLAVGKMTRRLAAVRPGDVLSMWGPLGNGFPADPAEHLVMVAGGIGQTPFLALAQEYLGLRAYGQPPRRVPRAARVTLCYGTRSDDLLAGVEEFRRLGVEVRVSTEDGSAGHHGRVTDLLAAALYEARAAGEACHVVCCGPEPMMEAAARIAREFAVPCRVSLESPMACGIGVCFSCVAKVLDGQGGWDYRRTCVEGPVFNAEQIVWHD